MSTKANTEDAFQIVTDHVIAQLEQGIVPWEISWAIAGPPANIVSQRVYRGLNALLLASKGYAKNLFITYKQLKELGGKVKEGEEGHLVTFWTTYDQPNESGGVTKIPIFKYYRVLNVEQCDGIPAEMIPEKAIQNSDPIQACKDIVRNMPNAPEMGCLNKSEAYYNVADDYINISQAKSLTGSMQFYRTLFRYLIHSTGHPMRLNRKGLMQKEVWGSTRPTYSQEDLTAEIGAYYLLFFAGVSIELEEVDMAAISGWLELFKRDKRCIIYASSNALKAVDHILNVVEVEAEYL